MNKNVSESFSPGKILEGRYSIIKILGHGGMGVVYLARDQNLNRNVAIKTILTNTDLSDEILERTKHEGRMLSRLRHPSLVTIYEMNMDAPEPYIVLDYIEGNNIRSLINSGRLLSNQEAMKLLKEQASALSYIHGRGLVHRDIKPENIIITPEGRSVLMDFGLAKDKNMTNLTKDGMFVGTLQYSPPEVLFGGQSKPCSDIYQLGLVVYEALTAQSYVGNFSSILELTTLLSCGEWDGQAVSPHISSELGEIIIACCRFKEEDRIQNGQSLEALIEETPQRRRDTRPPGLIASSRTRDASSADGATKSTDEKKLAGTRKTIIKSPRAVTPKRACEDRITGGPKTKILKNALIAMGIILVTLLSYVYLTGKNEKFNEEELVTRAYLVDFNVIEIRYNNKLKRELKFKIQNAPSSKTTDKEGSLETGFIDFGSPISSMGSTNTLQVQLKSPTYKDAFLTISGQSDKTFKLETGSLFQKKFKLLTRLSENGLIPLCRKFALLRSTHSKRQENPWAPLLNREGLNKKILDEYSRLIPHFLSSIDYKNNLYSEASNLVTPLRELSSFLAGEEVHEVFGLTSKVMGFRFFHKEDFKEDRGWLSMSHKNMRIDQTAAGSRFPILIYNFNDPVVKQKILDKASATGGLMTLALESDQNINSSDLMASCEVTLTTDKEFLAARQWPPQTARLYVSFQSYGASPYFTVTINGNKSIEVFSTWTFSKGMGVRVVSSIPIPVKWLNKEKNYLVFMPHRVTRDNCFDLIQTTLIETRLKVKCGE
jgi:serine/threonine-protein kinase